MKLRLWGKQVNDPSQNRARRLVFESLEVREVMSAVCLPTGPVVEALTECRNWITYSPSQPYNPNINLQPTTQQIRADLQQLFDEGFRGLVTYTLDGPFAEVPRIAKEIGFTRVIAGIFWFDSAQLQRELAVVDSVNTYADAFVVGNEGLGYNGQSVRYSLSELLAQIDALQTRTGKPVTTTETFPQYQNHPRLIAAGDWVFPNLQPWFNASLDPSIVSGMVQAVVNEVQALEAQAGTQVVVVKEAWWPTDGPEHASEAEQIAFFQQLATQPVFFVWGESHDQPWKYEVSPFGVVGKSWGFHLSNRTPKAIVSALASTYQAPYFDTRALLPGAINVVRQMSLPNGLPQNEATATELQSLSDTNNSIPANNRFFNPAQAGFLLTTLFLSHALRRTDETFNSGVTDAALQSELSATLSSLEAIANSGTAVYRTQAGATPQGIAFYKNYDSVTAQPRSGAQDKEVPFIDNGYLVVGLLTTAAYLRKIVEESHPAGFPAAAFLDLANRAEALARRINFALWFDPAAKQFRLGGADNPLAGGFVDRITSESRLVPVAALAMGHISRADFDAAMQKLVSESRSGSRTATSPPVERLSAFGTALELFVPTLFLATEMDTLFGQSTLTQSGLAMLDTGSVLGLPAVGAMGIANGGAQAINGGQNTYVNFGLSPTELAESGFNLRDRAVLVTPAAALMAAATGHLSNPQLRQAETAAASNLQAAIQQLQNAGQLHATYGAPNFLDLGSGLVNQTNPVWGFLEISQMAVALLNEELGGRFLESLLRRTSGWNAALEAYRLALNVRELEFSPQGAGSRIPRGNASEDGVWHLSNAGDSVSYALSVGTAGTYQIKFRFSNDDTGVLDNVHIMLDGQQVTAFATADTGDWNQFTETTWLDLGTLSPGTFQLAVTLAATDGFGIDLDTLSLKLLLSPWHNPLKPLDVNADEHVVAGNALAIINWINAFQSGPVPEDAAFSPPYLDVDNDFFVAPGDALSVINFINANPSGEGEGFSGQIASDWYFSALGSQPMASGAWNEFADAIAAATIDSIQPAKRRRLY